MIRGIEFNSSMSYSSSSSFYPPHLKRAQHYERLKDATGKVEQHSGQTKRPFLQLLVRQKFMVLGEVTQALFQCMFLQLMSNYDWWVMLHCHDPLFK